MVVNTTVSVAMPFDVQEKHLSLSNCEKLDDQLKCIDYHTSIGKCTC